MHDTLRARISFSFKGETYDLDHVIDLDTCPDSEEAPDFHLMLARTADIDPYSYLYEVLASHDIAFSEPTGRAVSCTQDDAFDWWQFVQARRDDADVQAVAAIALQTLGLHDLSQHADIRLALLQAYRAGKAA